jgi:mannose-6-phosphate isomerase-like protein (cupin superfamily)
MKGTYWLFGTRLSILADRSDTEGRYDLIEGWLPAGMRPPLHRHTRHSELFYALEGEITVRAGEREVVLRPGDSITFPVGMAHAVAATGGGPARGLAVASPSGFARLIAEVGTPDTGDGTPPPTSTDMELFLRVSAEVGDELLGPPGALPE